MARSASFYDGVFNVYRNANLIWVYDGAEWRTVHTLYIRHEGEWKICYGGVPIIMSFTLIEEEAPTCAPPTTWKVRGFYGISGDDDTNYRLDLYNTLTDTVVESDIGQTGPSVVADTGIDGDPGGGINNVTADYTLKLYQRAGNVLIQTFPCENTLNYPDLGNAC